MKYSVFVAFLLLTIAKAAFLDFEVAYIGERQPGEQLLGYVTNSTQATTEPVTHQVGFFLNAPEGSEITYIHMNIFPNWNLIAWPTDLPHNSLIEISLMSTTHLSVNAYYYGFLPESPEAIAAQANRKSDAVQERKYITNPDA